MNCHEVEQSLVAYIHNEVGRSERELIRAHIATCQHCQNALASATELQQRMSRILHNEADPIAPSTHAWTRLKARLTPEPEPTFAERLRRAVSAPGLGNSILPRTVLFVSTALIASFVLVTYAIWRPPTVVTETAMPYSAALQINSGSAAAIPSNLNRPRRVSGPLEDTGDLTREMRTQVRNTQTQAHPQRVQPDGGVNANMAATTGDEWLFVLGPADTARPARACSGCAQPQ